MHESCFDKDKVTIAFAKQPGNIPDVISVSNAVTQMESLGVDKPLIVTDNGYCSEHNLMEGKNARRLKLEKQLDKWLNSHSFAQIMDWYDCIETTTVKTETVKTRWSTESVAIFALVFCLLGMPRSTRLVTDATAAPAAKTRPRGGDRKWVAVKNEKTLLGNS